MPGRTLGATLATLLTLVLLTATVPPLAVSEEEVFPELTGPYLGQELPGTVPKVFAPRIVSLDKYREYTYVALPGAMGFVFDLFDDGRLKNGAVYVTEVKDGKWSEPHLYDVFAGIENVYLPRVSPDGSTWFFTSTSLPRPEGAEGQMLLYYIKKSSKGWSRPVYLDQATHASATSGGRVYYIVEDVRGNRPAYRDPEKSGYGDLKYVEPAASFGGDLAHLVVAPDESYMLFDSEQRTRFGECRLHISFRKPDGTWTAPMSLGGLIEAKATMPWITPDGKYIFFRAYDDVYWVDAGIIDKIRPKGITAKKN
jgi:hypothetical protein